MRAAQHAPRGRSYLLERRHGLAEMVERRAGVQVEHHGPNVAGGAFRGREGMFPGRYSEIFGIGEQLGCILDLGHSFGAVEAYI